MNMQEEEKKVVMNVPYFQVPNEIFDMDIKVKVFDQKEKKHIIRPLKAIEKIVYIYLCRCGNNGGTAFPSYNSIAERCGISRRKAIDAINILESNGFLVKKTRRKSNEENCSNIYELKTPSESGALPGAADALPSESGAPYKEPLYKETVIKNNNENGLSAVAEKTTPSNYNLSLRRLSKETKYWIKRYLIEYRDRFGEKHPNLVAEQRRRVEDVLESFVRENFLTEEDIDRIVVRHFEREINTDYNINHFATEGIIQNLLYELDIY